MAKNVETAKKRVIGLIGHGGAGKTSLADALVYCAGANERLGKVDDKTSILDAEPEEVETRHTIVPSLFDFIANDHLFYLIDTPGYSGFVHEAEFALNAVGAAVVVINAVDGVRVQTEQVVQAAKTMKVPLLAFVNAMDKERADFDKALAQIQDVLGINPAPLTYPIGKESGFEGVIDVLAGKAYLYEKDGSGKIKPGDEIPAALKDKAASLRETVIERLVEADDAVMESYLETMEVSPEQIAMCLHKGAVNGTFTPVFCGASSLNIGVRTFLQRLPEVTPSPSEERSRAVLNPQTGEESELDMSKGEQAPLTALVFKTLTDPYAGRISIFRVLGGKVALDDAVQVWNHEKQGREKMGKLFRLRDRKQEPIEEATFGDIAAVGKLKETTTTDTLTAGHPLIVKWGVRRSQSLMLAVSAKVKGEEEKVATAIQKAMDEDIGMRMHREPQTLELILSVMGQQHVDITLQRIKRMYGVEALLSTPKIPYRETVKKAVKGVEGKLKKQSGGRGQFGDCWINMEPLPRGTGFQFVDAIVGGSIPNQFIPAVEKGVIEAMVRGPLSGSPVQDLKVEVYDGKYHPVDSSEYAFKVAGGQAFKAAFEKADPCLLEPVMRLEITCPDENMGDIMGDLNSRRGKVLGMEPMGRNQIIRAEVPLVELQTYAPVLKSMTGDRGSYTMTFERYSEVPAMLAEGVIAELRKDFKSEEE